MSDKKERKPRKLPDTDRRCVHFHGPNEQCKVNKMIGFEYCYYHEPSLKEQRLVNSKKGGDTKILPPEVPPPSMETLEDVRQFTVETLHQVRTGHLEPRTAAVLSSLVAHVLKTLPDMDASTESISDKLRGLLSDEVSEPEEDDQTSKSVQGNRSGDWESYPVSSI
jgi:hypothetical protein